MKRFAFNLLACFLLIISLCAFASAKDNWIQVRSKNFTLVGNANEREIRAVAAQLEQFREAFERLVNRGRRSSSVPVTVLVFKNDNSFKPFKPLYNGKPLDLAGYFQSGTDMNYIALTTEKRAENPYAVIFHEYVHLLVSDYASNTPLWFNEGVAEYYSTFDVGKGDREVKLGTPIANHVYLLRSRNLLPLGTLLATDGSSPLYNEGDKRSIFYAQSWALVHYLVLGKKSERRQKLGKYFGLLAAGKSIEESFRVAFETDFAAMEKELREYVRRDTYPVETFSLIEKLETSAEMQASPLTEGEAFAYLGDLLLHTNRLDAAEEYLQKALALNSESAAAHASLGMLRVRARRLDEAKEHLEKAATADTANFLAHYYYAYALSREGMDASQFIGEYKPETVKRMRAELEKAIKLAPNFPNSYHLLAFINLVTGENLDEAVRLLRRALAIAPGRAEFSYVLAQVYMRKGDFAQARRILEPIIKNNPDPQLRLHAERVMTSIAAMEERQTQARASENQTSTERANVASSTQNESGNPPPPPAPRAPRLIQPAASEQQKRGTLLSIECPAGNSAVLVVQTADGIVKFNIADLTRLKLVTYTTEISGEITCGKLKTPLNVVVTYRPAKEERKGFEGDAVAVEFLPKDWSENLQ